MVIGYHDINCFKGNIAGRAQLIHLGRVHEDHSFFAVFHGLHVGCRNVGRGDGKTCPFIEPHRSDKGIVKVECVQRSKHRGPGHSHKITVDHAAQQFDGNIRRDRRFQRNGNSVRKNLQWHLRDPLRQFQTSTARGDKNGHAVFEQFCSFFSDLGFLARMQLCAGIKVAALEGNIVNGTGAAMYADNLVFFVEHL